MKKFFVIVPIYKDKRDTTKESLISDLSHKDEIRDFCTIEKAIKHGEKLFLSDIKFNVKMIKIFKTTYIYDMRRKYVCTIERQSSVLNVSNIL